MAKLKVVVDEDERFLMFGDGAGPKAVIHSDGWSTRTATIILADGSRHKGMISLCDMDSAENYGISIYDPEKNDLIQQSEGDFLEKLCRTKEQVYPYRYKYHDWQNTRDHHINENDGWSN